MPRVRIRSAKRRNRGSRDGQAVSNSTPGPTLQVYRGPIRTSVDRLQTDMIVTLIKESGTIASTAGGVIASVLPCTNPPSTSKWNSLVARYDEYRVLGAELIIVPINKYLTTKTDVSGVGVVDLDDVTALTSIGNGVYYESSVVGYCVKEWKLIYRMSGVRLSTYIPTASPLSLAGFKMYFAGLTASTNYFNYYLTMRVELRGSK